MKMTTIKMKSLLMENLADANLNFNYIRDNEELRIENKETGKGITIGLSQLVSKYEQSGQQAIDEILYYIKESTKVMGSEHP